MIKPRTKKRNRIRSALVILLCIIVMAGIMVVVIVTPVQAESPAGELRLSMMPFVYNRLSNVENIESVEHATMVLEEFPYLICGEPGVLQEEELLVADAIKDRVKIFGYVNLGGDPLPPLSKLKTEIDRLAEAGWYGVFIDQFGYDFGETRERQNEVVSYAHEKGLTCFVNCWFVEDAFGQEIVPFSNPQGLATTLGEGDWYLLESYLQSYEESNPDQQFLLDKCQKSMKYKETLGIHLAALTYKRDSVSWEDSKQDIARSYLMALSMGFEGWWFTDRTEYDSFLHGVPLDLNLGDELVQPFTIVGEDRAIAYTDRYLILFDRSDYPDITWKIYRRSAGWFLAWL